MTKAVRRQTQERRILVICGLTREAAIAAGEGVVAVAAGSRRESFAERLATVDASSLRAVVSFGLAGALHPDLRVGDIIRPQVVISLDGARHNLGREVSPDVTAKSCGALIGVNAPVLDPVEKARLHEETGADAVDMESHLAAAYAARHGLPFGVLRVISDGADQALPPAAAVAMRPDGGVDLPAVLGSVLRRPAQIPALIRTGRDAGRAFRELGRVRGLLGKLL